jgi:hypothetical protein
MPGQSIVTRPQAMAPGNLYQCQKKTMQGHMNHPTTSNAFDIVVVFQHIVFVGTQPNHHPDGQAIQRPQGRFKLSGYHRM